MQMTVAGLTFEISTPYAEGHTVTPAEAKTLNQTRKENISNAVRKQIEALKVEGTFPEGAEQKALDLVSTYDAGYTFSLGGGGSSRVVLDPVEKEALAIAKIKVNEAIAKKGGKVKDYDKDAYAAKVAEVAKMEKVVAEAKRRVASRGKMDLEVEV